MPSLRFKGRAFIENHHLAVPFHELKPARGRGLSRKASLHDNLIVEGDNLAALKALLPTYHGKVKCIYIDPPYNTGNEKWHYNDRVNSPMMREWLGKVVDREDLTRHDKWCCMMLPRLKLLRELLSDDGALFVSIDDNEVHRLRSLMDEVFGEDNFVATAVWQKIFSPKNTAKYFSEDHDFILCYARDIERWAPNLLERGDQAIDRYKNPDDDPRGSWTSSDLTARNPYSKGTYAVTCPIGRVIDGPPVGRFWVVSEDKFLALDAEKRIWWGPDGAGMPRLKRYLSEVKKGVVPQTLWLHSDVGHTQDAKKELVSVLDFERSEDVFNTVKPTSLIRRILVLIECEDYVDSITAERVRRVVKGVPAAKDPALKTGLGGTFSYFKLGEPMRQQSLLDASALPAYETLAAYVFFTATGEEFEEGQIERERWFIGRSRLYDVFLIYEPDVEQLKNLALSLEFARRLPPHQDGRRRLVFAPTKYLDEDFLNEYRITFQQLPFEVYETVAQTTKRRSQGATT